MRISMEWLKEFVALEDSPGNLADRLTFSGMEVEGIEPFGADLSGLVAAEVREVSRHPNADRLVVCRVFDGVAEKQVVCGAPNARAGGIYPFAPIGATLPDGTVIRPAKLRGVASEGMLCAEDELGLGKDHSGLLELPAGTTAGTTLDTLFGGPDTVLDLEITPNRPDCLSLLGVAREVAALYGLTLRRPDVAQVERGVPAAGQIAVLVEAPDLCSRYLARVLNVPAALPASPLWMRRRLAAAGMRAIQPLVDVTNYVQLECGHPLHAFDLDRVEGARIVVRRARDGERMRTLDGADRELTSDALVIADAAKPLALAGIMGGADSEITETTRRVLLESACFLPGSIRRTSRRLNLHSESSYRFSRGTDRETAAWASRRAADLMRRIAGAEVAPGEVDAGAAPAAAVTVACRWDAFTRVMGEPVSPDEADAVLRSLEFETRRRDADGGEWTVPTFRLDVRMDVDLIEEVARIRGLDRIPERAPCVRLVPGANDRALRSQQTLRRRLSGLGLTEILNYSLVSDRSLDRMDPLNRERRIRLPHPLSEDQSVLRTSLLPQMVETLGRNRSRQVETAACYEAGRVFLAEGGATREVPRLSIGLMGPAGESLLTRRAGAEPERRIQWMRGVLESLFRAQGVDDWVCVAEDAEPFEAGQALRVDIAGKPVGRMGLLNAREAAEWRLSDAPVLAELDLEPVLAHADDIRPVQPLPTVPSILRDLAFIVDRSVRHDEIVSVIRRTAGPELERVELFDVYEGRGIEKGRRSLAYAFTWRDRNRTLTDDEVSRYDQAIREALTRECGAEIRDR